MVSSRSRRKRETRELSGKNPKNCRSVVSARLAIDRAARVCASAAVRPAYTSRARTYARRQARTHYSYTQAGRQARTHATLGGVISTASERVLRGVSSNCAGERKSGERPRDVTNISSLDQRRQCSRFHSDRTLTIVIFLRVTNTNCDSITC